MFLTPGSRMVGRKGRRGKGDTNFISQQFVNATATLIIPRGATRANILMFGAAGGGGGSFPGCCVNPPGTGGGGGAPTVGRRLISNLVPGETLVFTAGVGGGAGSSAPTGGGTGGTTSLASGSCIITTSSIAGSTGGGAGTSGAQGAVGGFGAATNFDYVLQQAFRLPSGAASNAGYCTYLLGAGGGAGGNGTGGFMIIEWMF